MSWRLKSDVSKTEFSNSLCHVVLYSVERNALLWSVQGGANDHNMCCKPDVVMGSKD